MQIDGENTVVFVHIPKAAGSTITKVISRQYSPENIYKDYSTPGDSSDEVEPALASGEGEFERFNETALRHAREKYAAFRQLSESARANIRIFQGHDGYGVHEMLPRPCVYFTLLRDPVDRILSHYYYVKRNSGHYLYDEVTSKNMSLEDYVSSGLTPELDNSQTKYLAGLETPYLNFGDYSSDILTTAKQHIETNFILVGFTERFDETVLLLKRKLGWGEPYYTRVNVTENRPEKRQVSDSVLQAIEKYNDLDLQLYQYAQERFAQEIVDYGDSFKDDLERFQQANKNFVPAEKGRSFLQRGVAFAKGAAKKILN